jgi:hypothetical protein
VEPSGNEIAGSNEQLGHVQCFNLRPIMFRPQYRFLLNRRAIKLLAKTKSESPMTPPATHASALPPNAAAAACR